MLEFGEPVPVREADRAEYLAFAIAAAADSGAAALRYFRAGAMVQNKASGGGFDPVTEGDKAAEAVIRQAVRDRYPHHGLFGEEYGFEPGNGLTWVVDPIDGTRAFMTGMLHWGVLLALFDGQAPVVGVMHQPFTREFFVGDGRRAEYRCGDQVRPLAVSGKRDLSQVLLGSTGPQFFEQQIELPAFGRVRDAVRSVRYGGDCYIYAMVAMGHMDLAVEAGLNAYDIQALIPVIQGAGGVVTAWDGGSAALGGRVVAACTPAVHEQTLELLAGS